MSLSISGRLRRHRMAGDAPITCMAIIIGLIAIGIFCYYYFVQDRALENAGKDIVVVNKTDPTQFNNYRLFIRDKMGPAVVARCKDTRKAVNPIIRAKGTVPNVDETIEDLNKVELALREQMDAVNSQQCPKRFTDMHRNYAKCIGSCWQAVVNSRKAIKTEEAPERERLIKQASKDLSLASKYCNGAENAAGRMFD